jgi:hypothetical protein
MSLLLVTQRRDVARAWNRIACLIENARATKTYQVIQDLIPNNAHHLEALLAAD